MIINEQQSQAFKEFERTGWAKQAEHYDSLVGQMTRQAVDALLAAVNARSGVKLLDMASGPGYVAAEATRRGLDAIGTDIAGDMVDEARRRFAKARFEVADAENLSYRDASFDAVTCAFGMLHFPQPGKAVAEAYRVLRPGGRFCLQRVVWSCKGESADPDSRGGAAPYRRLHRASTRSRNIHVKRSLGAQGVDGSGEIHRCAR